jgi:hypothetical protein
MAELDRIFSDARFCEFTGNLKTAKSTLLYVKILSSWLTAIKGKNKISTAFNNGFIDEISFSKNRQTIQHYE